MEFLSLSHRRSSTRNVPSGEERGEMDVFAGYGVLWATAYISCSILFFHVHEDECESVLYLLVKEVLSSVSCMTYMGWFSWEQTIKFYSYTQSQYPTFWVRMGEDILQKMLFNINNKIALTLRFVSQLVEDQPLPVLGIQTVERG